MQLVEIHCFECNVEILDRDMYKFISDDRYMKLQTEEELHLDVDVFPIRELCLHQMDQCKEKNNKDYAPSEGTDKPILGAAKLLRPNFPCNFVSSSLYALSSLKYFRKVLKDLYLNNLENIKLSGKIVSSK